MRRAFATASLALLFEVAAVGQQPQPGIIRFDTEQTFLSVLTTARVSGSLQYTGKCGPNALVPGVPPTGWIEKPYPPNPVDTLRALFSVDSGIVVSRENNGTIRVVETGVQADILDVKISHLSFDRISDPEQALDIVIGAPEIQSFMRAHGIRQPLNRFSPPKYQLLALVPEMEHIPPDPSRPAISGELNDITLAAALDYLLKTFPGFWLYQNCHTPNGERVVYFSLFPIPGKEWTWDGTFMK